jgi:undecaprenyl-diphosphatase
MRLNVVLASIDDRLVVWMTAHRWPPLNDPMVWLGDLDRLGAVWAVLGVVIGLWLGFGPLRALCLGLFAALVTFAADAASFGVKDLFSRPRPFEAHPRIDPLYTVHSSSFPAGHAATAFAGALVLAYFAPRAAPLLFVLATAIGLSRIYVGVHYPTDVLAGAMLGLVVGASAIGGVRLARRLVAERTSYAGYSRGVS